MNEGPSEFDLPYYTTQWSKLAEKPQARPKRATYSRRGSMNSESTGNSSKRKFLRMKRCSSTGTEQSPLFSMAADLSVQEDQIEEEEEWGRRLSGSSTTSEKVPFLNLDGHPPAFNALPPPVPPRSRVFRRANSVSDVEKVPKLPPLLKRSHYSIDGSKRKKSRSFSCRNFMDNEFLSLNNESSNSNFAHDFEDEFDSPQAEDAGIGTNNPRILHRGRSLPVLPSPWIEEEDEEEEDDFASAFVPSGFVSPRKRISSPLGGAADFGASPPPRQLTAKTRMSSPEILESPEDLPTPLHAFAQGRYSFSRALSSDDDAMLSDSEPSRSTTCTEDGMMATTNKIAPDRKILQPGNATVNDVLQTMSSEMDVRFLYRAMAKEKNQPNRSQKLWNVALAKSWTTERRNAFLHWATHILGFRYAHAGENVYILQILSNKGRPLLELLQKVVETWDDKNRPILSSVLPNEFAVPSAGKMQRKPSVLKSENLAKPMHIDLFADSLLDGMKHLTMEDKPPSQAAISTFDVMLENDENVKDSDHARPSLDHHSTSIDLMSHMHGTTPIRPRQQGKPPRLSIQSTVSNVSMASPFPVMNFVAEIVSTPRIDASEECWGSCEVEGRDWGSSVPCDPEILEILMVELDQNCSECVPGDCSRKSPLITLSTLAKDKSDNELPEDRHMHESNFLSSSTLEITSYPGARVQFDKSEDALLGNETGKASIRDFSRREKSLAKRRRTALFATANDPVKTIREARKSMFVQLSQISLAKSKALLPESSPEFFSLNALDGHVLFDKQLSAVAQSPLDDRDILEGILDFLQEKELLLSASLVSRRWFEAATNSHANLMLSCVGCESDDFESESYREALPSTQQANHALSLMERPWEYLTSTFPWASFLSEGAYKRVYKVFNRKFRVEEAVSVMDVEEIRSTGNMSVVAAELAVSVMLGSLVRRGVCPNFVSTRGVFSCPYEPPVSIWGSAENKKPRGDFYVSPKVKRRPKEPQQRGRYQYIRMELCDEGDAEEFLKRQPDEALTPCQARHILFQIAFALYAGANRFSLKHYDLKLLNVFLQRVKPVKKGEVVLRYGLGEHVFSLKAPKEEIVIAKLADFGTAKVDSTSNGKQVTMAQFTTLENTPPDFLILGDYARQGHGHDNFGLGLCMLHLFTGHAPYEEIMQDVVCPPNLMDELRRIWEDEEESDYSVVRSLVLSGVFKDDDGHILEGEPDEVLYNTLYKFLVLFGIPDPSDQQVLDSKVMKAINATLSPGNGRSRKGRNGRKVRSDSQTYNRDRKKYSLSKGNNVYISRAREALQSMEGGMELLQSLVQFNPDERASALDVLNSSFMVPLREMEGCEYSEDDEVMSFTALSTNGK
ncbi:protein kinase domain containing protein [Nitzschia inconspicua]|uniref:Protein kinase domain containing protein n=1 Tax=Nitzschia inconspicua TaxID=303405 RepID=A0A9K3LGS2_9STRA|nr:protein kinase domain containing protein [Nitzschia inconspicua]